MTISHYRCLRCQAEVTEEHDGPPVRANQRVICKPCCRKSVNARCGIEDEKVTIADDKKNCRDCEQVGRQTKAHRLMPSGAAVCDEHYRQRMGLPPLSPSIADLLRRRAVPSEISPSIEEPKQEVEKENEIMASCKCGCGQQASAGREYVWGHKNKKPNGVSRPAGVTVPAPKVTGGNYDSVLAELRAKRDKLNAVIEGLEGLS